MNILKNSVVGLILARSGSKRLKNKNLLAFKGKPLIFWTIDEALKCKKIHKLILSTDYDRKLFKKYLINKKFLFIKRKKFLAKSNVKSETVIYSLKKKLSKYKYTCLLQPTSPLRKNIHIVKLIKKFENSNAD